MTETCEYCGHEGVLGEVIEVRNHRFVCIDRAACDARDEARETDLLARADD